jgi:HSP20 family protein
MKKEQIKVDYENGRLMFSSEMKEEREDNSKDTYTRREFSYKSFQRAFTRAENLVDGDKIKANYNEGILHISLPKREELKPKPARQIKIN